MSLIPQRYGWHKREAATKQVIDKGEGHKSDKTLSNAPSPTSKKRQRFTPLIGVTNCTCLLTILCIKMLHKWRKQNFTSKQYEIWTLTKYETMSFLFYLFI